MLGGGITVESARGTLGVLRLSLLWLVLGALATELARMLLLFCRPRVRAAAVVLAAAGAGAGIGTDEPPMVVSVKSARRPMVVSE